VATGEAHYVAVKTFIDRLDDLVLVGDAEMRRAIALILRTAHVVAEDAAAATVAAARALGAQLANQKVVFVISGGNLQLDRLGRIVAEHATE
jgi:threonine dehydratase